jgi:hypothetical protein
VADDRPIAAGQRGCQTPAFEGELGMADGVHTAMKAMESAGLGSLGDHGL